MLLPELELYGRASLEAFASHQKHACALVSRSGKCACGAAGGNPYATPEVSNHPTQEMAINPKLAPEATNGKPSLP